MIKKARQQFDGFLLSFQQKMLWEKKPQKNQKELDKLFY